MGKGQLVAPQGNLLAGNAVAVAVVPPQRRAGVGHLHANLMVAPGLQGNGAQGGALPALDALPVEDGLLGALHVRLADLHLVEPGVLHQIVGEGEAVLHGAGDHAQVFPAHFMGGHLGGEPRRRLAGAGEYHQPAHGTVHAVHQAQINPAGLGVLYLDVFLQLGEHVRVTGAVGLGEHVRGLHRHQHMVILINDTRHGTTAP